MKTLTRIFISCLLPMGLLLSCEPEATSDKAGIAVESISVEGSSHEIYIAGSVQLTASVLPENATDKRVAWMSTDESVATVDGGGLVTGVARGTATIRAITLDGAKVATFAVSVLKPAVPDKPGEISGDIEDFN